MRNRLNLFRECISDDDNECLVYGTDNLSQFTLANGLIASKCDRALPAARSNDVVVLRGNLDQEYQSWLRSLGLGTDHILAYGESSRKKTLSQVIVENPEPVQRIIQAMNKKPVYVPWFSSEAEEMAAISIGADLFGAPATLTWKYNEKSIFKNVCRQLDIPMVDDTVFFLHPEEKKNVLEMDEIIQSYLPDTSTVLIRGTLDNTGRSLVFKTSGDDIHVLYNQILKLGVTKIIIEPFLNVTSSPNDQWIITREKKIRHLGKRDQICKNGTCHIATIKQREPDSTELQYIKKTSLSLVNDMADQGYVGVIGIDYIVTDSGIYPVENNARFNGSSYVSLIVNNIEALTGIVPCWKFIKVKTKPCSFNMLSKRLRPILFNGQLSESVFPYNCDNLDKTGAFAVILMGPDIERLAELELILNAMGIE
ncbi:MAG: hypothetical protein JEZ12_13630 [Desulfobacterium sp.]|nr:hypothetical protein [Desulfobacterium sp.]